MDSLAWVGSWQLDKFHYDHLQPNEEFLRKARQAVDQICAFLKERCFKDAPQSGVKVLKVVKGGSLGKGTCLKQGSDADLVLFLNIFRSFADQEKERKMIITEFERRLKECEMWLGLQVSFHQTKWPNPRVSQFELYSKDSEDFIEFDVLPAYDALGHFQRSKPDPQIYVDLINSGHEGEFSSCFTELQRNFIESRTTKLKNLIRLVKYWYKEVQEKPFPPKYALELLTVYAWEQGSHENQFNMARGFRTVLWLIEHYKEICIYWTKYYDFDNETVKRYLQGQLRKKRPVILDPADPTKNLGEEKGWERLAEKAKSYASMICCREKDGSLVEPWDVPTYSSLYHEFNSQRVKLDTAFHPYETYSSPYHEFNSQRVKLDTAFHPYETYSSPYHEFNSQRVKLDTAFHPYETYSAPFQEFHSHRIKPDSTFHPYELAKEAPQEESWCTLL